MVDADKQRFNFHLLKLKDGEKSAAVDTGKVLNDTRFAKDHDGKPRDGKPDIGCYELMSN